jgi:hypothetical protein
MLQVPVVIDDVDAAERAWGDDGWGIALITKPFDVVELPPQFGAPLHHLLKATCPTAIAPTSRRWQFYLAPDSIPQSLVAAAGGHLHAGPSKWVPAPGTWTEKAGTLRWVVPPYLTRWEPYKRQDAIDAVLATVNWSAPETPVADLPRTIEDALE